MLNCFLRSLNSIMKVQKTSISYTALYLGLFYILFHGLGKGLDALAKGLDGD